MQEFEVARALPRGSTSVYDQRAALQLVFTAPIDLRPGDHVVIDMSSGQIEIVTRKGIAIWRSGWRN
jgi:hypothetical protein